MAYDNSNTIAVFKNDKKGNEKAPDYRIVLNVEGTDYTGGLWLRESEKVGKYMSGQIQPKEQRQAKEPAKANGYQPGDDEEELLPF